MGAPIARNLLRAGHDLRVWNRTAERAEPLKQDGAMVARTPAEAVAGVELVVTMLTDAQAVEHVMVESGALDALPDRAVWIQASTIGVAATERLVRLTGERNVVFVDAPVLGTKKPAEDGELVARNSVWLGEAGLGTRLKLVVNSWILCTVENIAETFVLARTLGLDPRRFLEAIAGGGMDMPYAHLKGEAILNEDFPASFPLRLARKDVALILEAAGELDFPLVRATLGQFDRALALGHGDEDMSAVYYASATRPAPVAGA